MAVFKNDDTALTGELCDSQSKNICGCICDGWCSPTNHYQTVVNWMHALQCQMHNYVYFSHQAARLKINEEFRKNKNETSGENIQKVQWECNRKWHDLFVQIVNFMWPEFISHAFKQIHGYATVFCHGLTNRSTGPGGPYTRSHFAPSPDPSPFILSICWYKVQSNISLSYFFPYIIQLHTEASW